MFMDLFSFYMKLFLRLGEVEVERNFGTNTFGHLFSGIVQMWF